MNIRTGKAISLLTLGLILPMGIARGQATGSICNDGTTSASTGKGTCSGHGGVKSSAPTQAGKTKSVAPTKAATKAPTKMEGGETKTATKAKPAAKPAAKTSTKSDVKTATKPAAKTTTKTATKTTTKAKADSAKAKKPPTK